jgi:hypothetical protein
MVPRHAGYSEHGAGYFHQKSEPHRVTVRELLSPKTSVDRRLTDLQCTKPLSENFFVLVKVSPKPSLKVFVTLTLNADAASASISDIARVAPMSAIVLVVLVRLHGGVLSGLTPSL